jgi:hypothetical protein
VATAHRDGRLVGFVLGFVDGRDLRLRTAGFDYDNGDDNFCYFNLAYYTLVRWAQASGVGRLWYGLSAYDAKRLRGCRFTPRWGLVRLQGGVASDVDGLLRIQHQTEIRRFTRLGPGDLDEPLLAAERTES